MKGPQQLRQEQQREQKLKDIEEQVADGKLVIRQMTPEERRQHPPAAPRPGRSGKRRS